MTTPPAVGAAETLGMAIVGIGCHAEPFTTVDELERALFEGRADLATRVRPPDAADQDGSPVARAARQALRDGGAETGEPIAVALLVLAEEKADPEAGRRLAQRLATSGPVDTLAGDDGDLAEALRRAHRALRLGGDVLVCAEDSGGAVAVLLSDAARDRRRAYAVLDAMAVGQRGAADRVALEALGSRALDPRDVEYLGLYGADAAERDATAAELGRVWSAEAVGVRHSVLAPTGESGPRAMLTAVVRAALCLHHCYLPAVPEAVTCESVIDESATDEAATARSSRQGPSGERSGLYLPSGSHPWLRPSAAAPRRASVAAGTGDHRAYLLLSGAAERGALVHTDWSRVTDLALLPVCGRDPDDLVRAVARTRDALDGGADLAALAARSAEESAGAALRAVFCVTPESVGRELGLALGSLPRTLAEGRDWASPGGSCCAARPIGPGGGVALVFPGIFGAFPGFGRDLLRCFPGELAAVGESAFRRDAGCGGELVRRLLGKDAAEAELAALERELYGDAAGLTEVGILFAVFHTRLLRSVLGLRQHGALGYSLGEISMLAATGWLSCTEDDLAALFALPLFDQAVGRARQVVRAAWNLPEELPDGAVWGSRVVFAGAAEVRERLSRFDRVFLTHVNTPGEVVVAGDPAQCEALAEALGRPSIPSAYSHLFHTPLIDTGRAPGELGRHVRPTPDAELLSAHGCRPLDASAPGETAADVVGVMRRTVDFPRLVRAAYLRGYRYFLEVGPGGVCTRWVDDCLADRPHVAEAVERRGMPADRSMARLLARLASHGLPVDLAPFLPRRPRTAPDHALVKETL
ncbi:hypothetical protein [Peterkaempfera bronchialis]|uniref:hypothetical protein n=1 Tax=Peterkaempfera bronchialis TaxID=2126346 RepID=UPI003C2F9908